MVTAIADKKTIQPSEDQELAINTITEWLSNPRRDLVMGGYAGSGKSTVISYLYDDFREARTLFMAPTGKAADILRSKGMDACTIHQAIYLFMGLKTKHNGDEVPIFEDREGIKSGFAPRLLAIDEGSMVNGSLYRDIKSKGLPCFWIGDHFQLPPVGDDPGIMQSPDIRLEKIHRQAEGSSILGLAHAIRQGKGFDRSYVDNVSTFLSKLPTETHRVRYAIERNITQTIVSFNATRISFNKIYRKLTDKKGMLDVGDRIVITHNDWGRMLFNGQFFTVTRVIKENEISIKADVISPMGHVRKDLEFQKISFGNAEYKKSDRDEDLIEADYAYATTCHRCQGDSFDRVLYIDQPCKLWPIDRHRYTGITRAVSEIHVAV